MSGCRICGSAMTTVAGTVEYFYGRSYEVVDCTECGCRQTRHDADAHELLHRSGALDHYAGYRDMAESARVLFAAGDRGGLRRLLEPNPKYRFAMDAIDRLPAGLRVLEIGCSRGYLTAYALLAGLPAVGVDASADALESARMAFGEHFLAAGAPQIRERGPYDLVFHVGLIGCVADPMGLTRELLGLLSPRGGRLVFNAPNLDARETEDQLWLDSAPPPDLVTLFPEGFWAERFGTLAQVVEDVERRTPRSSFEIALRRAMGARWTPPVPREFRPAPSTPRERPAVLRGLSRLAEATGIATLVRQRPTEFGQFVTMRPRSGKIVGR